MAYALVSDLVARFGELELIQITDRATPPAEAIDCAVAQVALDAASNLADSHIAVKYALPLATTPAVVVDIVCDIARYRLYGDQVTDLIKDRNAAAMAMLKRIADGTMKIDAGPIEPSSRPVVVLAQSNERLFTRDSMRGG